MVVGTCFACPVKASKKGSGVMGRGKLLKQNEI